MTKQDPYTDHELIHSVLTAIKNDDVDALTAKIQEGIPKDINFPPELDEEPPILRNGAPFICMAAYFGSLKCLKYLILNGWDVHNTDDDGLSVSFFAAAAGRVDIIKFLRDQNIDVTGCGQSSLRHHKLDAFKELLSLNIIKITDIDFLHSTYLHIAAYECDPEATKFILTFPEVDVNAIDREGRTPLHLAAGNGSSEVCQLLLENKNINPQIKDHYGKIPLYYAAVQNEQKIIELFLGGDANTVQKDGKTPLMRAVSEGNPSLAKLIIDLENTNINVQNNEGMTALHFAIKCKQEQCAILLINEPQIDLNIKNNEGQTPLHIASVKKEMEVVKALLKKGASATITDNKGHTAMDAVEEKLQKPPKPPKD